MNERLAKKIRAIAFSNTPSSEERKARKWVVLTDRKGHQMLRCLDPRATLKAMKKNIVNGTVDEKKKMRKEIDEIFKTVKQNFPKGIMFGEK